MAKLIIVLDDDEYPLAPAPKGTITALAEAFITLGTVNYRIDAATEVTYSYKKELDKITTALDAFLTRRNNILTHLLARFNEGFDDYTLDRLDLRKPGDKDGFYEDLIDWKESFLKNYVLLSRDRSRGFKHYRPYGLQIFGKDHDVILQVYDLENQETRAKHEAAILKFGVDEKNYELKPLLYGESILQLNDDNGNMVATGLDTYYSEDVKKQALEPIIKRIQELRDDPALQEQNIKRYPHDSWPLDSGTERRARLLLGIPNQAPRLAPSSQQKLPSPPAEDDPSASEGLYLVEHILLWPLTPEKALTDDPKTGDDEFIEQDTSRNEMELMELLADGEAEFDTEEAAKEGIAALAAFLRALQDDEPGRSYIRYIGPYGYTVSVIYPYATSERYEPPDPNKPYGVRIVNENSVILLSAYNLENLTEREQRIKDILAYGTDENNYRMRTNAYGEISLELYKTRTINNDLFYSYRVSVFFPDWPPRFVKNAFKRFAVQIVRENAPAHVALDFYWLDEDDMATFETLYFDWVDTKATFLFDASEDTSKPTDKARAAQIKHLEAKMLLAALEYEILLEQLKSYIDAARRFTLELFLLADLEEVRHHVVWKRTVAYTTNPRELSDRIITNLYKGQYATEFQETYYHYSMAWIEAERARIIAEIMWRAAAADPSYSEEEVEKLKDWVVDFEKVIVVLLELQADMDVEQDYWSFLASVAAVFAEEIEAFAEEIFALEEQMIEAAKKKKQSPAEEIDMRANKLKWFIVEQQDKQKNNTARGDGAATTTSPTVANSSER